MRRREFITLLGGAAAWPLAARAQPAKPVIGFLGSESRHLWASRVRAFHQGLSEAGYVVGRNVSIEYRWAENQLDRLPALAADLVRQQAAVIVANGPAARATKAATTTIPIVFVTGVDPVAAGLVASLNRPGGNLTGVTTLATELDPKRLELLRELLPAGTLFAVLINPASATAEATTRAMQEAARTLGVSIRVLQASADGDLDTTFAALAQMRAGAFVISTNPFFNSRSQQIAELALRHAVPTIYQYREFAAAGGLMSYGGNITDAHRLVGMYTGRILGGEEPGDLPVQLATKVELIINLKTAKAFGLTVPLTLRVRADEVIE
jgi:putative ABC transport system substrate-binding protein